MKADPRRRTDWRYAAGLLALSLFMAGWSDGCDSDNNFEDHVPAAGQGSLVIDNRSNSELHVYIDGKEVAGVDDTDNRIYDLAPGVYRLVLDEDKGDRNYRADIDILQDRLTVLEVSNDSGGSSDFTVDLRFE